MFVFLILGSLALRSSSRNAAAAAAEGNAAHLLSDDINHASDFLTDQVRSFVVTQDRASLDLYWAEIESARNREKALAKASALKLPDNEMEALRRAKRESDALVVTETRAMRLVADALDYNEADMPPAVAAARPGPADRALSKQGKLSLAKELVFGTEYWQHKRAIRGAIDDFRAFSQVRTSTAARAIQTSANREFALVAGLCALALVGVALVVVLYYRLVALPVRHYIGTLATDEIGAGYPELKPEGAYELISLAETINRRRAQQIRTEATLRDSELRLRTNLLMMPLAAMEIDKTNRIRSWNPAAELMFGYLEKEVLGLDILDLIVPGRLREEIRSVIDRLARGEVIDRHINTNTTKDGREIVCEWYNTPIYDSRGAWIGWVSLIKDITEQQTEAEKILYLSRHDPLTDLLNRRSMQEKLDEEHQRCMRTGGSYSTIMLDIDKFKLFNDRYGHECGDVVLKGVADSLTQSVRATDSVARWGGEEFLILLPETDCEGGTELAEKIRQRIEADDIAYGDKRFSVTITAGVANRYDDDASVDDCVRRADEALLKGKASGRNRVIGALC